MGRAAVSPSCARRGNEVTGEDHEKSHGIRFNAVSPGPVDTPLYSKLGIEDPAEQAAVLEGISAGIPLGRMGLPEEVAEAVVYLASDASAFAVGQDLILDGGSTVL
ncbi:SDR family oxidoreductase [Streptomyces sp. ID05-04B]|nr:SDR family oxidoreductase [Streptomyces sp. ID05-04B]